MTDKTYPAETLSIETENFIIYILQLQRKICIVGPVASGKSKLRALIQNSKKPHKHIPYVVLEDLSRAGFKRLLKEIDQLENHHIMESTKYQPYKFVAPLEMIIEMQAADSDTVLAALDQAIKEDPTLKPLKKKLTTFLEITPTEQGYALSQIRTLI